MASTCTYVSQGICPTSLFARETTLTRIAFRDEAWQAQAFLSQWPLSVPTFIIFALFIHVSPLLRRLSSADARAAGSSRMACCRPCKQKRRMKRSTTVVEVHWTRTKVCYPSLVTRLRLSQRPPAASAAVPVITLPIRVCPQPGR